MNIQWYPGHMTRTRRQMAVSLKQVDAVCEVVDARIPQVSRNPDMDEIAGNKPPEMQCTSIVQGAIHRSTGQEVLKGIRLSKIWRIIRWT